LKFIRCVEGQETWQYGNIRQKFTKQTSFDWIKKLKEIISLIF
jgi:hypothetical protein